MICELCVHIGEYAANESILQTNDCAEIDGQFYAASIFMDSNFSIADI